MRAARGRQGYKQAEVKRAKGFQENMEGRI